MSSCDTHCPACGCPWYREGAPTHYDGAYCLENDCECCCGPCTDCGKQFVQKPKNYGVCPECRVKKMVRVPVTARNAERGETAVGEASFFPGCEKNSVAVVFKTPITVRPYPYQSASQEFRLRTGWRIVWGQGTDDDVEDWQLDAEDCKKIVELGGGH